MAQMSSPKTAGARKNSTVAARILSAISLKAAVILLSTFGMGCALLDAEESHTQMNEVNEAAAGATSDDEITGFCARVELHNQIGVITPYPSEEEQELNAWVEKKCEEEKARQKAKAAEDEK